MYNIRGEMPPSAVQYNGRILFNPGADSAWCEENGYIYEERPTTAFDTACTQFKQVCAIIGQAIGNADFKGGFDEYTNFIQSDFAKNNPAQAALYASMWSGANEYAKYEGAKLGYGQPEWWYKCFETK